MSKSPLRPEDLWHQKLCAEANGWVSVEVTQCREADLTANLRKGQHRSDASAPSARSMDVHWAPGCVSGDATRVIPGTQIVHATGACTEAYVVCLGVDIT